MLETCIMPSDAFRVGQPMSESINESSRRSQRLSKIVSEVKCTNQRLKKDSDLRRIHCRYEVAFPTCPTRSHWVSESIFQLQMANCDNIHNHKLTVLSRALRMNCRYALESSEPMVSEDVRLFVGVYFPNKFCWLWQCQRTSPGWRTCIDF